MSKTKHLIFAVIIKMTQKQFILLCQENVIK